MSLFCLFLDFSTIAIFVLLSIFAYYYKTKHTGSNFKIIDMRKVNKFLLGCVLAALIGIIPILSYAQDDSGQTKLTRKEKRQDFKNYLYINANIGGLFNNTDVAKSRFGFNNPNLGFGGALGWQFKPIWGIRGKIGGGWVDGDYDGRTFERGLYDYHADLTINFSNLISGYRADRVVDIYAILGGGAVNWKDKGSDQDFHLVFEANGGVGAAFHLSPKFDLNLEYELKYVNSDTLDKYNYNKNADAAQWTTYDMFSYASVGVTYKFGQGDPLKKMKKNYETVTFKAEPDPLEAHGGKVPVKITGTFPAGYFHPKAAMYIEPALVCDGNKIQLKPILLKGTSVEGEGITISKDGGSFTYETVVDYDESCRAAELILEPVLFMPKGALPANMTREDALGYKKSVELPGTKVADGTIVTPEKFAFDQTGAIVPHGYLKEEILTKNAKLFFEVNKYALNWNVPLNKVAANKAKLNEVFDYMKLGYKVKDINIDGWASPEGEETFNQGLSENRSKTAKKYLVDEIKKLIKAKDSKLTIKDAEKELTYNPAHHGPDWNGFIYSLQNSDIKEKNSILNVINSAGTPARKEEEIRNMIKIYPEIEAKLLEPLRRAEIVVNCYMPKKTDEEIAKLAVSNPGALDEKELLYAASMQQDKKAKLDIYKTAIKQFPESYKGYANAGGIEIEMNDIPAAKAHLEKAASLNANSGEVHNNLGIVYGVQGDYAKAEEHFVKANQLGTDANYNLGVLSIHKGEYSKALTQFGSKTCDYNVALAYIASKNYPPAEKQLSCAANDAKTYYLKAILGSRMANTNMLFDNLAEAIKLDAAYKAEAKIDREFIKYFNDPKFTDLVK